MKKILLISNYVFHYRQKLYNYFADEFRREGYEFHVMSDEFQDVPFPLRFIKEECSLRIASSISSIRRIKPDVVIVFLHLKDIAQLPIFYYCKIAKIKVIFWNKGVSSLDVDNKWKNAIWHHMHNISDAIITYTPDMKCYFEKKNHGKMFIGYNTVNNSDIDKSKYDKDLIKNKYNIKERKVVLYVSRLLPYKRVDILMDALANEPDVAVVVMGAGITPELQAKFDSVPNLYYMGQKYGDEGNEIWSIGDVFCIPHNTGLGVNDAIFWNLPIVTMTGHQPPEIYYLKDGKNGYIVETEAELKEKLLNLLFDEILLSDMKTVCKKVYKEEVDVKIMFKAFFDAIKFCNI